MIDFLEWKNILSMYCFIFRPLSRDIFVVSLLFHSCNLGGIGLNPGVQVCYNKHSLFNNI